MSEIKLPDRHCPLCKLKTIQSTLSINFDRSRLYYCPNCGSFSISLMAFYFTPIYTDKGLCSKLSYFIRHNATEEKPVNILKDNYEDIVKSVILPSVSMQLENFLLWFGDNSKYTRYTAYLPAFIGCNNPVEIIQLLDELWKKGFIEMENPTTAPLREREFFDAFCGHLTSEGIEKIEEIRKRISPLNFDITVATIEPILQQKESSKIEVKGSCRLNLNRLLIGDKQIEFDNKVALDGILKAIVAFLNTKGGTILIGALEQNKFTLEQMKSISYKSFEDYYLIGILIENTSTDNYELRLRSLIAEHISKELVELIDITFPEFSEFTFCKIVINKASHKWYYLDKEKFYVRNGNRSDLLYGEDADSYKKRNPR